MVDENQTAFPNATPKMVILFHGQEISIRLKKRLIKNAVHKD